MDDFLPVQMGLELAEVVQAASRRGSLASDEGMPPHMQLGRHLRPNDFPSRYPRSRSPSPIKGGFHSPAPMSRLE